MSREPAALLSLVVFLAGCSREPPPRSTTEAAPPIREPAEGQPPPRSRPASPCAGVRLQGEAETYRETTNPTISGFDVGISNIFERDVPDDAGVVAKRLSASLSIHDPKTDALRREIVVPGQVVTINTDRYCVVAIDSGDDAPGSVSLRQLAP